MKRFVVSLMMLTALLLMQSVGLAQFNSVTPLAAPADGNNYLYIDDLGGTFDNSFVSINTGIPINVGETYEITAATGRAKGQVLANQSIQMWAGPAGGTANTDFMGQNFSQSGSWNDAPDGDWVDNSLSITNNDFTLLGKELIILVTNFALNAQPGSPDPTDTGRAYWDNFRVTVNGGAPVFTDSFEGAALAPGDNVEVDDASIGWFLGNSGYSNSGVRSGFVPEPTSFALLGLGAMFLAGGRRRKVYPFKTMFCVSTVD